MADRDDGGPAFPHAWENSIQSGSFAGMSQRDYFAGQALSALSGWVPPIDAAEEREYGAFAAMSMARARWAYAVADAMLAERAKGGG